MAEQIFLSPQVKRSVIISNKYGSLLNYVPFVPTCLTCLRALRAYVPYAPTAHVPTCPKPLRAHLPTRLKSLRARVPTCPRALNHYAPTCLRAHVPPSITCLRAYNHSQNILRLTSISRIAVFSGLFDLSFHSKPPKKLLLLKLYTPVLSCGVLLSQLVHAQKQ